MQSRDYVMLRAIEWTLGAAVVVVLIAAINSGWLTSSAQRFSDWYAAQVDGLLEITVVSTTVRLPHVERADLPLRDVPQSVPAFSASTGEATATADPSSD